MSRARTYLQSGVLGLYLAASGLASDVWEGHCNVGRHRVFNREPVDCEVQKYFLLEEHQHNDVYRYFCSASPFKLD